MSKKANASDLLGINARNSLYVSRNSRKAKAIARSKYATKILLNNNNIPCAEIYGILGTDEDVNDFAWQKLEGDFVIKPTNGHAGTGVIAFRTKVNDEEWLNVLGEKWSIDDIKRHCRDILAGQYSIHGSNHNVIIEERIPIHPKLLKYSYKGTPDVRVIVFNSVPVMAMLRLPTEESGGRANVSQGAIAVGIDIASGITTYAVAHKKQNINYLPGTKKKLNGIVIPNWQKVLLTAVKASDVADLAFSGVDIFLHKTKGPMVVELNATPGLSIQAANQAGLRRRLERVEGLNVVNPEHGVKIAQALFASDFSDRIKVKSDITTITLKEEVSLYGDDKKSVSTVAFINTGRLHSAIARDLAGELGLLDVEDLLWFQKEKEEGSLPVVEIKLRLRGQTIKTTMLVSKKLNHRLHKVEIGRKDLDGFIISPNKND
ncbi:MAG: sugar-transfer associated ATP-grasp domain-containing protein [Patescibacteria group bacterium]